MLHTLQTRNAANSEVMRKFPNQKNFETVDLGGNNGISFMNLVPDGEGKGNETVADGVIENFL